MSIGFGLTQILGNMSYRQDMYFGCLKRVHKKYLKK